MIAVTRIVRSIDRIESDELKDVEREQLRHADPLREIDLAADLLLDALKDPQRALHDPIVPAGRMALRAAGDLLASDPIFGPTEIQKDKKQTAVDAQVEKEKPTEAAIDQAKKKAECAVCCESKKDDKDPKPDEKKKPDPDTVVIDKEEIKILEPVHFAFDKWDILPESAKILGDVATVLKNHPEAKRVRVEGHTDVRGKDAYNQGLSEKRAASVVNWLVDTEKVEAARLVSSGKGESTPLIPGATTEAQHFKNRRVEFHVEDGVIKPVKVTATQTATGLPTTEPPKGAQTAVPEEKGPKPIEKPCGIDDTKPTPPPVKVEPTPEPPKEEPKDPPKTDVVVTDDQIITLKPVHFVFAKAELVTESEAVLKQVAEILVKNAAIRVRVEGHTDVRGKNDYNLKLSKDRVATVVKFLTANGVAGDRLEGKGMGEEKPKIPDAKTEEQHLENRRVEFHILPAAGAQQGAGGARGGGQADAAAGGGKGKNVPQGGQGGPKVFIKATAYDAGPGLTAPVVAAPVADVSGGDAVTDAPEAGGVDEGAAEELVAEPAAAAVGSQIEPAAAADPDPGEPAGAVEPSTPVADVASPTLDAPAPAPDRSGNVVDADPGRRAETVTLVGRIGPKLGLSPSEVEVRVDAEAARRTAAVGAPGVLVDGVIWLDPAAFDPDTKAGQHLLAHEMAHVAQTALAADGPVARADVEADAGRFADAFVAGGSTSGVAVPLSGGVATYDGPQPAGAEAADDEVPPPPPAEEPLLSFDNADDEVPPPPPEPDEDEELLSFEREVPPPPPAAEARVERALPDAPAVAPAPAAPAAPPDPVQIAAAQRARDVIRVKKLNALLREKIDQLKAVPKLKGELKTAKKLLAQREAALAKARAATQGNFSKFAGWITRASDARKAAFEAERLATIEAAVLAVDEARASVRRIEEKLAELGETMNQMERAAGGQAGGLVDKQAEATATRIHDALDRILKDRETVADALLGKSPVQLAQIEVAYFDHYQRELATDLKAALVRGYGKISWNNESIEEALVYLRGDRVESAKAALANSASSLAVINLPGLHHDFNNLPKMEAALWDLDAVEREALKADPKVQALIAGTTRDWKQVITYLLDGKKAHAVAVGLHRAMHGAGTDEAAVYDYLRRPGVDHTEVADAFQALYQTTVTSWLEGDFSGPALKRALALWNVEEGLRSTKGQHGDAASVDRARDLKEARGWFGTSWFNDPKVIVDRLNGMTKADRAEMFVQFGGRDKFEAFIEEQLDDKYLDMARSILEEGEAGRKFAVSDDTAVEILIDTHDVTKVLYLLQGKSAAEMAQLKREFVQATNQELEPWLLNKFGGRKRHSVAVALLGEPQTPAELVKVAALRYDFERGSGSNWFSKFWMAVGNKLGMSEAGALMDREWAEIQELTGLSATATSDQIDAAVARLGDAQKATVAKLGGRIASDAERYKEAKDALTKCLVMGTSIAVGAIVTLVSAGTMAPLVAGALGALCGSAASLSAKAAMQGAAYSGSELTKDIIIEAVLLPLKAALVNVSFFGQVPEGAGPITTMLKVLAKDLPGPNWTQEFVELLATQGAPRLAGPALKALLNIPSYWHDPEHFADILEHAKAAELAEANIQGRGGRG